MIFMILKRRFFILVVILAILIVCLSGLVYAAAEKLYKQPITQGTFVYNEINYEVE